MTYNKVKMDKRIPKNDNKIKYAYQNEIQIRKEKKLVRDFINKK